MCVRWRVDGVHESNRQDPLELMLGLPCTLPHPSLACGVLPSPIAATTLRRDEPAHRCTGKAGHGAGGRGCCADALPVSARAAQAGVLNGPDLCPPHCSRPRGRLDWYAVRGWRHPPSTQVLANVMAGASAARAPKQRPVFRLGFFGRLEERKGLVRARLCACAVKGAGGAGGRVGGGARGDKLCGGAAVTSEACCTTRISPCAHPCPRLHPHRSCSWMQWSGSPPASSPRPSLRCPLWGQNHAWTSRRVLFCSGERVHSCAHRLAPAVLGACRVAHEADCACTERPAAPRSPGFHLAPRPAHPAPTLQLSSAWLAARTADWTWKYTILASAPRAEALREIRQPGVLLALCSLVEVRAAAGRAACAALAGGGGCGALCGSLGALTIQGPPMRSHCPPPPTSRTLRTPWPRPLLMACPLSHTTWEASLRCWSLAALQVSSAHACRARGGGRPCCARPRQPASDGVHGARQPTTSTLQAACAAFIVRLVIDIPLACSQSCRSPPTSRVPCSRCATSWPKCCVAGAGPRPRCAALTATQVLLPVILLCAPTVPARSPSALPCFPPALLLQTRYGALGTLKACCPRGRANAHWRRLGCRRAPRCTPCPSTRT